MDENIRIYVCEKCGKEFTHYFSHYRHINKKLSCVPVERKAQFDVSKTCDYCKSTFKTKRTLEHHIGICVVKKCVDDGIVKINNPNIAPAPAPVLNNNGPTVNIVNNNVVNNIINIKNVNIVIENPIKKIDKTNYTSNVVLEGINNGMYCIPNIFEKTHFDVNKPELHNICYKNTKEVSVYTEDGWKVKNTETVLDDAISNCVPIIKKEYSVNKDKVNIKFIESIEKFMTCIKDQNNIDPETESTCKEEMKKILYNYRHIAKNTRDTVQKQQNKLFKKLSQINN
jgi:hypothetical protein